MGKRKFWTKAEDDALNKLWHNPQISRQNILDVFIDRTWSSIAAHARSRKYPSRASIETQLNEELLSKLMKVVDG